MDTENITKSLRKDIENAIEPLIENHVAFKTDPLLISVDEIVADIMKTKEIKDITKTISSKLSKTSLEARFSSNLDIDDYICASSSHSDKTLWSLDSKTLRENLLSKDEELFQQSYKAYVKLIKYSDTVNDAALNIIRTLKVFFLNLTKQFNTIGIRINLKINTQCNVLKVVELLLLALSSTFKYHKQHSIQVTIIQLMELISLPTLSKKMDKMHFLNYATVIDPEALWFRDMISVTFNRNVVVEFLKENPSLIEYLMTDIYNLMYHKNDFVQQNGVLHEKISEINIPVIKLSTFYNYLHIMGHLLHFSCRSVILKNVKIKNSAVTTSNFIKYLLDVANNISFDQTQAAKLKVITSVLKNILVGNREAFNSGEVVKKFVLPMKLSDNSRSLFTIANKFMYIFEVCVGISRMEDGFSILFGRDDSKHSSGKSNSNPHEKSAGDKKTKSVSKKPCIADTIVNFTTSILRYFLSSTKKKHLVFPYVIINHCIDILTCEYHILYWYNCETLILGIKDLYYHLKGQKFIDLNNLAHLEKALYAFCIPSNTFNVIKEDGQLIMEFGMKILAKGVNCWDKKHFGTFLHNLCGTDFGREVVLKKKNDLIRPFLLEIWRLDEDEHIFMSGSDRKINESICRFLKIVLIIAMDFECFQVMYSDPLPSEPREHPMNLHELIEHGLSNSGPDTVTFTALCALRVLVTSLDVLAALEGGGGGIVDRLAALQGPPSPSGTLPLVMDQCVAVRQYTLDYLALLGLCDGVSVANAPVPPSEPHVKPSTIQMNELHRFMRENREQLHDKNWLCQFQRAHRLSLEEPLRVQLVQVLPHVRTCLESTEPQPPRKHWPTIQEAQHVQLTQHQLFAVNIILRYGVQSKIISSNSLHVEQLSALLRQAHLYRRGTDCTGTREERCMDWDVCVMYLLGGRVAGAVLSGAEGRRLHQAVSLTSAPLLTLLTRLSMQQTCDNANIPLPGLIHLLNTGCLVNQLPWTEICHWLLYIMSNSPENICNMTATIVCQVRLQLMALCDSTNPADFLSCLQLRGLTMHRAVRNTQHIAAQHNNRALHSQ